jgi:hypothetical protein
LHHRKPQGDAMGAGQAPLSDIAFDFSGSLAKKIKSTPIFKKTTLDF